MAIDLVVPDSSPIAKSWRKEANSRGEGRVLMRDGHLLVAKEKKPPALIEFGPVGAEPMGAGPDRLLGPTDTW